MSSLSAGQVIGELTTNYGLQLTVLDLYSNPTIGSLAKHLSGDEAGSDADAPERVRKARGDGGVEVGGALAVVGVAARLPGAADIGAFWKNLGEGHDALRFFSDEELEARGVSAEVYGTPGYVKAGQVVDDVDKFDAAFWGIGPSRAKSASHSLRRELLMPLVNPGSLCRCGKRT